MGNIMGTNFKSISVTKNILKDGDMLDVMIHVGSVKVATFTCPLSSIAEIIKANI